MKILDGQIEATNQPLATWRSAASSEDNHATLPPLIKRFDEIGIEDIPLVGGKNASLGEMRRTLTSKGVPVPDGFATTAAAYWHFLDETDLRDLIEKTLADLDVRDIRSLQSASRIIRDAVTCAILPSNLETEIRDRVSRSLPAHRQYRCRRGAKQRNSGGFAGGEFCRGAGDLPERRRRRGVTEGVSTLLCVAVLRARDLLSGRQGLSRRPKSRFRSVCSEWCAPISARPASFSRSTRKAGSAMRVLINAAYGLGENIVKGAVNPDEYCVFKPTLRLGFRPILQKIIGSKEVKMIYDTGAASVKNVPVAQADRMRFALSDDDILKLARWACLIEEHYGKPMDVEWAKDGITGELFIVQARPETVQSRKDTNVLEFYELQESGKVLLSGRSVGAKIASGPVRVIRDAASLDEFQEGEVLVAEKTDPDWEPIMKKAAAIITDRGGRTCHAAIVSRELGVPAVVGTQSGTKSLKSGQVVTVSCAGGDTGFIYEGQLPFRRRANRLEGDRPPAHADHDERGESGKRLRVVVHSKRWRRSGARRIHRHATTSKCIRWRWLIMRKATTVN